METKPAQLRGNWRPRAIGAALLLALLSIAASPNVSILVRLLGGTMLASFFLLAAWTYSRTTGRVVMLIYAVSLAVVGWLAVRSPAVSQPVAPLLPTRIGWFCDTTPARIPRLAAGLLVGNAPPKGWSRLVETIRPRYRPAPGAFTVPGAIETANAFSFCVVARERLTPDGQLRLLEQIAIGVSITEDGKDRIVSARDAPSRKRLSWVTLAALKAVEKDIDASQVVARTPHLWIYESQCHLYQESQWSDVLRRTAVLLCPGTGRTSIASWDRPMDGASAANATVLMHDEALEDEISLRLNRSASSTTALFGMVRRPAGSAIPIAGRLRVELDQSPLAAETVRQLERTMASNAGTETSAPSEPLP